MTDEDDFITIAQAHNERARKLQAETKANMNINYSVDPPAPNYIKPEDIKVGDKVRRTYSYTTEGTVTRALTPGFGGIDLTLSDGRSCTAQATIDSRFDSGTHTWELLDRPTPKPAHGSRWIVSEDSWASDTRNVSTAFPKGTRLIYNSMSDTYIVFDCAVEDSGLLGFVVPVKPKSPDDNVPFLKSLVPYGD